MPSYWTPSVEEVVLHEDFRLLPAALNYAKVLQLHLILFQMTCNNCSKSSFKTRATLKQHRKNCCFCTKCETFRTFDHVAKCKVVDTKTRRCFYCFKPVLKLNFRRHLAQHKSKPEVEQVTCSLLFSTFVYSNATFPTFRK